MAQEHDYRNRRARQDEYYEIDEGEIDDVPPDTYDENFNDDVNYQFHSHHDDIPEDLSRFVISNPPPNNADTKPFHKLSRPTSRPQPHSFSNRGNNNRQGDNNVGNYDSYERRLREAQLIKSKPLPIDGKLDQCMDAIRNNQVTLIKSNTGSGKTTVVPLETALKLLKKSGEKVLCSEPRRIAAKNPAGHVSKRNATVLGSEVGYQYKGDNCTNEQTLLAFMTTGTLLAILTSYEGKFAGFVKLYPVVFLDEAHERGLDLDTVIGLFKGIVEEYPNFRLVIMSATISSDRFLRMFPKMEVVDVGGKPLHPVKIFHVDDDGNYWYAALLTVLQIHYQNHRLPGDIIVILPTIDDTKTLKRAIEDNFKYLKEKKQELNILDLVCFTFTSKSTTEEANQALGRGNSRLNRGIRKVILTTNIIESAVTVENGYFVVDSGFQKSPVYDSKSKSTPLLLLPTPIYSAQQRAGRVGRVGKGEVYRLYSAHIYFNELLLTMFPEVVRTCPTNLVLSLKASGIEDVINFPYLTPPSKMDLNDAVIKLIGLGALSSEPPYLITDLGRIFTKISLSVEFAKAILTAVDHHCLDEMIVIGCMVSEIRSIYECFARDYVIDSYIYQDSDHITLLTIFSKWFHRVRDKKDKTQEEKDIEESLEVRDLRIVLKRANEIKKNISDYLHNTQLSDKIELKSVMSEKISQNIKWCLLTGFYHNLMYRPQDCSNWSIQNLDQVPTFEKHSCIVYNQKFGTTSDALFALYHKFDSSWNNRVTYATVLSKEMIHHFISQLYKLNPINETIAALVNWYLPRQKYDPNYKKTNKVAFETVCEADGLLYDNLGVVNAEKDEVNKLLPHLYNKIGNIRLTREHKRPRGLDINDYPTMQNNASISKKSNQLDREFFERHILSPLLAHSQRFMHQSVVHPLIKFTQVNVNQLNQVENLRKEICPYYFVHKQCPKDNSCPLKHGNISYNETRGAFVDDMKPGNKNPPAGVLYYYVKAHDANQTCNDSNPEMYIERTSMEINIPGVPWTSICIRKATTENPKETIYGEEVFIMRRTNLDDIFTITQEKQKEMNNVKIKKKTQKNHDLRSINKIKTKITQIFVDLKKLDNADTAQLNMFERKLVEIDAVKVTDVNREIRKGILQTLFNDVVLYKDTLLTTQVDDLIRSIVDIKDAQGNKKISKNDEILINNHWGVIKYITDCTSKQTKLDSFIEILQEFRLSLKEGMSINLNKKQRKRLNTKPSGDDETVKKVKLSKENEFINVNDNHKCAIVSNVVPPPPPLAAAAAAATSDQSQFGRNRHGSTNQQQSNNDETTSPAKIEDFICYKCRSNPLIYRTDSITSFIHHLVEVHRFPIMYYDEPIVLKLCGKKDKSNNWYPIIVKYCYKTDTYFLLVIHQTPSQTLVSMYHFQHLVNAVTIGQYEFSIYEGKQTHRSLQYFSHSFDSLMQGNYIEELAIPNLEDKKFLFAMHETGVSKNFLLICLRHSCPVCCKDHFITNCDYFKVWCANRYIDKLTGMPWPKERDLFEQNEAIMTPDVRANLLTRALFYTSRMVSILQNAQNQYFASSADDASTSKTNTKGLFEEPKAFGYIYPSSTFSVKDKE